MKFGFVIQHRPSPWEKDKRMRPLSSGQDLEWSVATMMIKELKLVQ